MKTFEETLEFVNNPELNLPDEVWRPHPIYENLEGSNFGRVRKIYKGERYIKKQRNIKDYTTRDDLVFSHRLDNKKTRIYSARFILECFEGPGNMVGYQCDHINSIEYDNRIENLRWTDNGKENMNNLSTKEKQRLVHKGTSRKKIKLHISELKNFSEKKEKWKKHPYYENIEVSNFGRIIEKIGDYFFEKVITTTPKGYCKVTIGKNENRKNEFVHRLVAQTWIPNPDNKPEVDHIDGEKNHNWVTNLKWSDRPENMNNPITKSKLSKLGKITHLNETVQHFDEYIHNIKE